MFAIEFNETNLPKILKTCDLSTEEATQLANMFFNRSYIFISGYYDRKNRLHPWGIVPQYVLEESFDYDAENIQTDWDIVVRKPAAA